VMGMAHHQVGEGVSQPRPQAGGVVVLVAVVVGLVLPVLPGPVVLVLAVLGVSVVLVPAVPVCRRATAVRLVGGSFELVGHAAALS
jgi:hypothetical protein